MIDALQKILPQKILRPMQSRLNFDKVFEIRFRAAKPVSINYGGKFYFLSENGISQSVSENTIIADAKMVSEVVVRATDFSLYAVNDQLKAGFLTLKGGVRVGIAGEMVREGEEVKTVKNFSSVNIRIPHEVIGCGEKVYKKCFESTLHNTLILSPPGVGKTTMLRDLARTLGNRSPCTNVLVVDERNELAAQFLGTSQLDVGTHTDVIANCSKEYAFSAGLRTLAPHVIVTDELAGEKDIAAIELAAASGVCVIASVHAGSHLDLKNKQGFEKLLEKKLFRRFANLEIVDGVGVCVGVYDAEFNEIEG
ncbi:MAG: stage III sporulation protein AA [Firmicutes bacterium]|nr:stage III sporulation protein AA [Bacillota bacterium]